jgi:heme peroxidase
LTLFFMTTWRESHMPKPQTQIPGKGGFFSLFDLPPTIFNADVLQRLAAAMGAATIVGTSSCDSGYVYLGQFITHDITKRASAPANEFLPASQLVQQRTPALDLDNVYGDGFDDPKIAIDRYTGKMLLGRVVDSKHRPGSEDDLPRAGSMALIGDDRDDENLLVAQLHVQFLKLHNLFVDRIREYRPALQAERLFDEARRNLTLCYQDVVLYDFLRTVLDRDVWDQVVRNNKPTLWQPLRAEMARMPIEFAAAAFRFAHNMVRPKYSLNDRVAVGANDLFAMTGTQGFGGRRGLPDTHIVDWRLFFAGLCPEEELPVNPNMALTIDPTVGVKIDAPGMISLTARDLITGNFSMLPDAQAIVHHLQATYPRLKALTDAELNPESMLVHLRRDGGKPGADHYGLTRKSPLFYYVLCEAYARQGGNRLGQLGSLIIAETLRALTYLSSPSVLHKDDEVSPAIGVKATGEEIDGRRRFRMIDLLKAVGPPPGRQNETTASDLEPLSEVA